MEKKKLSDVVTTRSVSWWSAVAGELMANMLASRKRASSSQSS